MNAPWERLRGSTIIAVNCQLYSYRYVSASRHSWVPPAVRLVSILSSWCHHGPVDRVARDFIEAIGSAEAQLF